MMGIDHPFGHVLGRGGFHIRPEQGRYEICPYSLDQNNDQGQMTHLSMSLVVTPEIDELGRIDIWPKVFFDEADIQLEKLL